VSHDRALIDTIATHTLALEDGAAVVRPGGYGDLVRARAEAQERAQAPAPAPARRRAPEPPRDRKEKPSRAERKRAPRKGEVRRLEGEIARVEAGLAEVERALADPAVLADRDAVAARGEEHRGLQEELAWLLREWERAAEAAGV